MILAAPVGVLTAAVSLLAILVCIGTGVIAARARRRVGIMPPAMTGHPELERALRVQGNTLEQFAIFLPALWLAAVYFGRGWVPALGLAWCAGRVIYAAAYSAGKRRELGFALTVLPTILLLVLAAIGVAESWTAANAG